MAPSTPFVDSESGSFDFNQIIGEAVPVAKLVGLFVGVALVPAVLGAVLPSVLGALLFLVAQLVLAVGSALTLMYVIVRGLQLADRQAPPTAGAREEGSGRSTTGGADADAEGDDGATGAATEDGAGADAAGVDAGDSETGDADGGDDETDREAGSGDDATEGAIDDDSDADGDDGEPEAEDDDE